MKMWKEVDDVFETGIISHKFGMGKWVTAFEQHMAKKEGYPFCCLYGAGTKKLLDYMIKQSPDLVLLL